MLGALDEKLNEVGYIVPGLGDAGDRLYGTSDLDCSITARFDISLRAMQDSCMHDRPRARPDLL